MTAPGYTHVGRARRFSATRSSVSMCWNAGGRTEPAAGTMSARWSVIWLTTWQGRGRHQPGRLGAKRGSGWQRNGGWGCSSFHCLRSWGGCTAGGGFTWPPCIQSSLINP